MSFVIYRLSCTKVVSTHDTSRGALISLTALKKRIQKRCDRKIAEFKGYDWATAKQKKEQAKETRRHAREEIDDLFVASREDFDTKIDHMVTRRNLLSGKEFQIRASQADTFLDPSTESYHSM